MSEYVIPPMREELPTLPCDLREYARIATGPLSWEYDRDDTAWQEAFDSIVAGRLVRDSDVPRITLTNEECTTLGLGLREDHVLSLLDGETDVEAICDASELTREEVLTVLTALCARGVVALEGGQEVLAETNATPASKTTL
jgi:hypothetical protein